MKKIKKDEVHIQPILILSCIIIAILLFCRDVLNIGISKTIFTFIVLLTTTAINIPNTFYYMFFLFPLGIGLPANYFIIFFLIKFLVNSTLMQLDYKISFDKTFSLILLVIFALLQNIIFGYTGMYHTVLPLGYILIYYMTSYQGGLDIKKMLYFSIAAIFIIAFIMFFATINEYGLTSFIDGTYRFAESVSYTGSGAMSIGMDPNYLGFYCLSSLTSAYILIRKKIPFLNAVIIFIAVCFSCFVGLIALSRAYILSLFVFVFLAMLVADGSFKNCIKNIFIVLALTAIAFLVIKSLYPELIETITARFQGDDMATGNGRTTIIKNLWVEFTASPLSFIFGLGIFIVTVHCMPLQILYGFGVFGAILWCYFYSQSIRDMNNNITVKRYYAYIPLLVMLFMSASIPIAQSTVIMFLFVIAMYACRLANED